MPCTIMFKNEKKRQKCHKKCHTKSKCGTYLQNDIVGLTSCICSDISLCNCCECKIGLKMCSVQLPVSSSLSSRAICLCNWRKKKETCTKKGKKCGVSQIFHHAKMQNFQNFGSAKKKWEVCNLHVPPKTKQHLHSGQHTPQFQCEIMAGRDEYIRVLWMDRYFVHWVLMEVLSNGCCERNQIQMKSRTTRRFWSWTGPNPKWSSIQIHWGDYSPGPTQ